MSISGAARNSLVLLLPVLFLAVFEILGLYKFPNFALPIPMFLKIHWRQPLLLQSHFNLLLLGVLLSGVIFFQSIFKNQYRKILSSIGLSLLMIFYFEWKFFLGCSIPFSLLYFSVLTRPKNKYFSNFLIFLGFASLLGIQHFWASNKFFFFLLFAQVIAGVYSTIVDHRRYKEKLDPWHCWVYWFCFPGGLFSILYSHREFVKSYFSSSYSQFSRQGVVQIFLGLVQLSVLHKIEISFYPQISLFKNKVSTIASSTATFGELWSTAGVLFFFTIFEQVATLYVLQGITKIFGYNVISQVDNVLKSRSFLDWWKRGSYNSRMYMLNYFYFPVIVKTRNFHLANASVWLFYGILATIAYGGVSIYHFKEGAALEIWIILFTKICIGYTLFSSIEMAGQIYLQKMSDSNKRKVLKFIFAVAMYLLFLFVYIIGHEYSPSPNESIPEILNSIQRMFTIF